jgi:ubiquinone biosynthesis protein
MVAAAKPFVEKVKLARYSPQRISEDLFRIAGELMQFTQQFPKDMLEIARMIRRKRLSLTLEHQGLQSMLATHDQISNRISFSIIIAGLIIGSALIVISKTPPLFYGISLIGIIGFLAAAVMGFWLLIAIIRKGRL